MRDLQQGKPFHGEFSDDDASALTEGNSRFTLYDTGKTAITLTSSDQVVITDIIIANNSGAAMANVTVYDGADATVDAGERITPTMNLDDAATSNPLILHLQVPHYCKQNTYPKLKAAAGQIDAGIKGVIIKN